MKINPVVALYQVLIAWPILVLITILVAIATIILSPVMPNCNISYYPARWWGRMICYLLFVKVRLIGLEKIDLQRSYVIAANHQSIFDIFAIYGWLPNIFKWIMKAELRKIPLVGKACESAGHIFINRSNPIAAKLSLDKAEQQLVNGVSVVVFPEGTRTRSGAMGSFKKGAFRMATDLGLPILPITIRGSFDRISRKSIYVYPGTIEMIFHDAVDVKEYLPDRTSDLMEDVFQIIVNPIENLTESAAV